MNVITHNLLAINANRQLNITASRLQKRSEKLVSGYRINRAADDAAGLSISEKMRAQIRGLNRGTENLQDGISYVQVADGALNEVHSILQRINELSVQAANGTNSDSDREALDLEVQALKTEMEHIFKTTTFNDRQIWPEESISNAPTQIGTTPVQALTVTTSSYQYVTLNNSNFNKVAYSGSSYVIHANQQGVHLSWTDYDGVEHNTKKIDWDTLEANNYSFRVGDYFDTDLQDADGNPLFDFNISFSVDENSTIDNIIGAIDGTSMSSSVSVTEHIQFEKADGTSLTPRGISASISLSANAMYASRKYANTANGETGFDYEQDSDSFAIPSSTSGNMIAGPDIRQITSPETNKDLWKFSFEIEGIGTVTATSKTVTYSSPDKSAEAKDLWWYLYRYPNGTTTQVMHTYPEGKSLDGTLSSIVDSLTGDYTQGDTSTPGLLDNITDSYKNTGDKIGTINLAFDLVADQAYRYGKTSGTDVGSMTISINVYADDTVDTVLERIGDALNSNSVLDIDTKKTTFSKDQNTIYKSSAKKSDADKPVYENHFTFHSVDLRIQSGPTAEDGINISYQCLRVEAIGLLKTNLLSEDSSTEAIKEIQDAISIISTQRSLFGAYQNRMEHALSVNKITSENTGAAESRIRDTDMAGEILNHSKENILLEVSQSMLAQANVSPNGVLTLLT